MELHHQASRGMIIQIRLEIGSPVQMVLLACLTPLLSEERSQGRRREGRRGKVGLRSSQRDIPFVNAWINSIRHLFNV
jgi:hypothetical protein